LSSSIDDRAPKPFSAGPAWHGGLAILWRLTGSPSQIVAQIYQAGFYLLLLLSVYFGVRQIWGVSAASWTWLLIATMPMVCVYSILLYQDVPGIAVLALALLLLWRKNFLWAGVCLGVAYLIKMNMLSYAPWAVVFAAWWAGGTWKRRLKAALGVAAPVALAFGYDVSWRLMIYGHMMHPGGGDLSGLPAFAITALQSRPEDFRVWDLFPVYNPQAVVENVGVAVIAVTPVALVRVRDVVGIWLWACLGLAVAGFVYVFTMTEVRYLFPSLLILVLLCGKGIADWRLSPSLKAVLVAACVIQAVAACVYTYNDRQISEFDAAAYAWIRENAEPGTRILVPEEVVVNQTGRSMIWWDVNPAWLMSEGTDEQIEEILRHFHVSHMAVPLRRVYDREKEGSHSGGWAREFLERARGSQCFEKVYENPGYVIFRFNPRTASAPNGPVPGRRGPS
jgi:hypothetical protein